MINAEKVFSVSNTKDILLEKLIAILVVVLQLHGAGHSDLRQKRLNSFRT